MTNDEKAKRIGVCAECGHAFDLQGGLHVPGPAPEPLLAKEAGDKEVCFPCWLSGPKRTGYEV